MQVDPEYLRTQYASMSDEELATVDREDLVRMAQTCYDDEVAKRRLQARREGREFGQPVAAEETEQEPEPVEINVDVRPGWIEDAAVVFSAPVRAGYVVGPDVADASKALEDAGIPCFVEVADISEEVDADSVVTAEWRVLVPGNLNLRATSVLDRDIFNNEFEETWKVHLETLSDSELREARPEFVFCGLFDKVERVKRVYRNEIERRRADTAARS